MLRLIEKYSLKLFICSLLIVCFGTVLLSSFSWRQWGGEQIVIHKESYHDALWHLALMRMIEQSVPPLNPTYAGERLVGYHYFSDGFWVIVHLFTRIPYTWIYLNIAPIILAAFFTLTTLWVFLTIVKNRQFALLGASITLFGSGFAYVVPFVFPLSKGGQSVFWLDQTVHLGVNQQLLLSLSVVNIILVLSYVSYARYWKVIGVLIGSLLFIKVYATMLLLAAFLCVGGFQLVVKREWKLLQIVILAGIVTFLGLMIIGPSNHGFPFIWEPGWFYKTMFESGDRLNFPRWELIRLDAVAHASWHRLIVLWGGAFSLFFVGNFGVKMLGVLAMPFMLWKERRSDSFQFWLLIAFLIGIAIAMPTFFLQKGVVWNTIQFLPYMYVPLGLLLTLGVSMISISAKLKVTMLMTLLLISLPTTLQTVIEDSRSETYKSIPIELVQDVETLGERHPTKRYLLAENIRETSIITAFSGKAAYWADPGILSILGIDHTERFEYLTAVEKGVVHCQTDEGFVSLGENSRLIVEECPRKMVCE